MVSHNRTKIKIYLHLKYTCSRNQTLYTLKTYTKAFYVLLLVLKCLKNNELIARMVPVVSRFFTFSPHLLEIAGMLPMVCHFVKGLSE
ncbi:hypothetical protein Hanom_Chr11g00973951 [Helianthus anomalus]